MTHPNSQETEQRNALLRNLKTSFVELDIHFRDLPIHTIPSQEFRETVKTIEKQLIPSQQIQRQNLYGQTYYYSQPAMFGTLSESEEVTNTVSIPAVSYYPHESIGLLKDKITQLLHSSIHKALIETYPEENYDVFEAFINRQLPSLAISINLLLSKTAIRQDHQSGFQSVLVVEDFHARLKEFLKDAPENIVTSILEYMDKEITINSLRQKLMISDRDLSSTLHQNSLITSQLQENQKALSELQSERDNLRAQLQTQQDNLREQLQAQTQQVDKSRSEREDLEKKHEQDIADLKAKYEQDIADLEERLQAQTQQVHGSRSEQDYLNGSDDIAKAQITSSSDRQLTAEFTEAKLSEWLPPEGQVTESTLSKWLPPEEQVTGAGISKSTQPEEQVSDQNSQGPNKSQNYPNSVPPALSSKDSNEDQFQEILKSLEKAADNQERFTQLFAKLIDASHKSSPSLIYQSRSSQAESQTKSQEFPDQSELIDSTNQSGQGGIDNQFDFSTREGDSSTREGDFSTGQALHISSPPQLASSNIVLPSPVQTPDLSQIIRKYHQEYGNVFITQASQDPHLQYYIIFLDISKDPLEFHELSFNNEDRSDELYSALIEYTDNTDNFTTFEDLKKMILASKFIDQNQSFIKIEPSNLDYYLDLFVKHYASIAESPMHAEQRDHSDEHHSVGQDIPETSPRDGDAHQVSPRYNEGGSRD